MQAPAVSPSGAHSFEWAPPGSPVKVALDLRVVEGIQRGNSSAGNHVARTNQGVLLGEIVDGTTRIAGIRPVPGVPGDIIARAKTKEPSVGLYFVRPGGALQLSELEIATARSLCERRNAVVLLVCLRRAAPPDAASAEATFFFFEAALLCGGTMPFPFDAAVLSRHKFPVATPSGPEFGQPSPSLLPPLRTAELPRSLPLVDHASVDHASVDHPSTAKGPDKFLNLPAEGSLASLSASSRAFTWRRSLTMTLLAIAAIASGAALTRMFRMAVDVNTKAAPVEVATQRSASADGRIAVHAQRQGSDLKITWDEPPGSPDSTGMLSIIDGATHRLLPLEFAQLRFGSLLYAPVSDQVRVELTISHGDQVYARGSVLVLISGPAPAAVRQDLVPAVSRAASAPRVEAQSEEPIEQRHPRPARPFLAGQPAGENRPSPAGVELPLPPPVLGQPAAQMQMPPVTIRPELLPPAAPVQYATVSYTAAVPVYKAMPVQPAELRGVLGRETNVRVKVQIDAKGRVTKADPLLEKGVHQLVAAAAARAALGWKFNPAHIGDRAVPSEMTLEFRFRWQ